MKKFLKTLVLWVGALVLCRFIWNWSLDSAFGIGYETTQRLKVGWREGVVAPEDAGATTDYATSIHVLMPGSNPSTSNRVLVIPSDPKQLKVTQKDNVIFVEVAGANKLHLDTKQSFSGIEFNLSFSEPVTE